MMNPEMVTCRSCVRKKVWTLLELLVVRPGVGVTVRSGAVAGGVVSGSKPIKVYVHINESIGLGQGTRNVGFRATRAGLWTHVCVLPTSVH